MNPEQGLQIQDLTAMLRRRKGTMAVIAGAIFLVSIVIGQTPSAKFGTGEPFTCDAAAPACTYLCTEILWVGTQGGAKELVADQ